MKNFPRLLKMFQSESNFVLTEPCGHATQMTLTAATLSIVEIFNYSFYTIKSRTIVINTAWHQNLLDKNNY